MAQFADPHLQDALDAAMAPAAHDPLRTPREAANVRLVAALYARVAGGRFDGLEDAFTDDVRMDVEGPPGTPMTGSAEGPGDVVARVRANFALVDEQTPRIVSVGAGDDTVTVAGREEGRLRDTGAAYAMNWVHQFTFRGDRIARFHEVLDPVPVADARDGGVDER